MQSQRLGASSKVLAQRSAPIRRRVRVVPAYLRLLSWLGVAFVWLVWAATLVATLGLVEKYGSRDVPFGDDIAGLLPGVVQPLSDATDWLWAPHNEHRLPLPKLILWSVLNSTDFNLKAVQYLGVLAFGLMGALLIFAARKIRGHTAWTDTVFPLVLMCWSQASNFLNAWQIQFISSTVLAGILLTIIAYRTTTVSPGKALVSSACVLALPLCGGNGVLMVPVFALWLGMEGLISWRMASRRWPGGVMMVAAVASIVLIGVYLNGLDTKRNVAAGQNAGPASLTDYLYISLEFLSTASGPPLYERDGWSLRIGAAVLAVLLVSGITLAYIAFRRSSESFRALGLGAVLSAVVCIIVAYSISRAPFYPGVGLQDRYYTLLIPAMGSAYLAWVLLGGKAGLTMQVFLFAIAAFVFERNVRGNDRQNLNYADMCRYGTEGIEKAVAERKTIAQIAQLWTTMFANTDQVGFEEFYEPRFRMLHKANIGPYRFLPDDPALVQVEYPFDAKPVGELGVSWNNGVCRMLEPDAWLVFSLPEPRFVYKIRVTYKYAAAEEKSRFELAWRLRGVNEFDRSGAYMLAGTSEEKTVTVIVNEKIDQFRIQPAAVPPCEMKISRIDLFVPVTGSR